MKDIIIVAHCLKCGHIMWASPETESELSFGCEICGGNLYIERQSLEEWENAAFALTNNHYNYEKNIVSTKQTDIDYISICPKCKNTTMASFNEGNKCPVCGNTFTHTALDYEMWLNLLHSIYPEYNINEITDEELAEFIYHQTFNQNQTDVNLTRKRQHYHQQQTMQIQAKLKQLSTQPHCPKCQSTDIGKGQRGFKWGRAIGTVAVTGFLDVGAIAGAAGSNKIVNICNNCGHKWG